MAFSFEDIMFPAAWLVIHMESFARLDRSSTVVLLS
jgi:hypothetical protein